MSFGLCISPLSSFPQGASGALALIELLKQGAVLKEAQQFGLRSHGLGTGPLVLFSQACVLSATQEGWPGRGSAQQQGKSATSDDSRQGQCEGLGAQAQVGQLTL